MNSSPYIYDSILGWFTESKLHTGAVEYVETGGMRVAAITSALPTQARWCFDESPCDAVYCDAEHCAASKGEPSTELLEEQEEQAPRRCWDGSQCTKRVCDESCSWARHQFTQHASYCEDQFLDGVIPFNHVHPEPEPRHMTLTFENVDGILTPVVL